MCSCLCTGGGMCGCMSVLSQSGDDCHAMTTSKSRQRRLFLLINFRRTSLHVRCASVWVCTRLGLGPVILYPLSVLKTDCTSCVAGHTAPVDVVVTACGRRQLPLSTSAIWHRLRFVSCLQIPLYNNLVRGNFVIQNTTDYRSFRLDTLTQGHRQYTYLLPNPVHSFPLPPLLPLPPFSLSLSHGAHLLASKPCILLAAWLPHRQG